MRASQVLAPLGAYYFALVIFTMMGFADGGRGTLTVHLAHWYSFLVYIVLSWMQGWLLMFLGRIFAEAALSMFPSEDS